MRRRHLIALVGGSLASWPWWPVAHAAERVYRIGFLVPVPAAMFMPWFDELSRLGFVEGQNLVVERRGFSSSYQQFANIAAELSRGDLDAIICGGDAAIRAAQAATKTIPIIGATDDMVGAGLAQSLVRPGGNTTGVSVLASELDGKRQEILFDLFPTATQMAVLADPETAGSRALKAIRDAASARGVSVAIHQAKASEEIAEAVKAAKASGAAALNVLASPLLFGQRAIIIAESARLHLPAIYQWPDTAREGGLLGYGPRFSEFLRQWARQAAKVLRGANPGELPIDQPTRFELAINLKTAAEIGLEVPPSLISRADEVIE